MGFTINIANRFPANRDVKIHHRRHQQTPDHHTIEANSSKDINLNSAAPRDKEYMVISLDHAPGEIPACQVILQPDDPQHRADFTFIPSGAISLHISHIGNATILRIPGRACEWKLKVAKPTESERGPGTLESQNVTLAADEPGMPD